MLNLEKKHPKAFISYAWEPKRKKWVKTFATKLRKDAIDCILDQWELLPGDQIPKFMANSVKNSDYVLIICTPKYKEKSDRGLGGVGYEGDIMTAEVLNTGNNRKFIPILREGDWHDSSPTWLSGKLYVDLRKGFKTPAYRNLVLTIHGQQESAPPLGDISLFQDSANGQYKLGRRASRLKQILIKAQILIVNDHPHHMTPTSTLLTNSGIEVDIADSTNEAIRLMKTKHYDAVISDMKRGEIEGEGQRFLNKTRELGISRPTIFSVARFEAERGVPPYAFGISNYVDELVHLTFDVIERERG